MGRAELPSGGSGIDSSSGFPVARRASGPVFNIRPIDIDGSVVDVTIRPLSPRQKEILGHVAMGESMEQIASALGISYRTVENHFYAREPFGHGVLEKLGAVDSNNAVLIAINCGLLDLHDLTKGYDFATFASMTPREFDMLEAIIVNSGNLSSTKQLKDTLDIRGQTIKNELTVIYEKLGLYGAGSKIRASVLYLRYKELKREEIEHRYSGA